MTYSLTLLRHAEKKEYSLLYEKKQKLMLLLGNPTNRLQVQHHIARSVCWIQWILLKTSLNGGVQCRNGVITQLAETGADEFVWWLWGSAALLELYQRIYELAFSPQK